MVWAGITSLHRTRLVIIEGNINARRYCDEILCPVAIPFLREHGPGLIFQQDNARPHSAAETEEFLTRNEVEMLPWPANSPDLSPIEHLWDEMERRIRRQPKQPASRAEFHEALLQAWDEIPQTFIARLISSMKRRMSAVIKAEGGHTRY